VVVVDLVDDEHAVASAPQSRADDLLAVTLFVVRRGVDQVQTRVHRAMDGGDAAFERDLAVGEIANPGMVALNPVRPSSRRVGTSRANRLA